MLGILRMASLLAACAMAANASPQALDPDAAARAAGLSRPLYLLDYYEAHGVWLEEPRVWGGREASAGDDPWQVALIKPSSGLQFCGGSLIAPDLVLTAAHCVENGTSPRALLVVEGTVDLNQGGRRLIVSEIISHRNWTPSSGREVRNDNDVALLRLQRPALSRPIALIGLKDEALVRHGAVARLTGFGRISTAGPLSRKLKFLPLNLVDNRLCNDRTDHNGAVKDTMLCAANSEIHVPGAMCDGDSGGPLTLRGQGGPVLIGIVSFGPTECGNRDVPGVYTRVSSFLDWIAECRDGIGSLCDRVT